MKPPTAKTYLLSHTTYRTTKEPAIASRIRFNDVAEDNDLDRLFKGKALIEDVVIAMLLVDPEITHFDAEPDFLYGRRIIHPSGVDGARGGERPR